MKAKSYDDMKAVESLIEEVKTPEPTRDNRPVYRTDDDYERNR